MSQATLDRLISQENTAAREAAERAERERQQQETQQSAEREAAATAYVDLVLRVANDEKVTESVIAATIEAAGKSLVELKADVDAELEKRQLIEALGPDRIAALPDSDLASLRKGMADLTERRRLWALIQSEPSVRQRQADLDQQLTDAKGVAQRAIDLAQQTELDHTTGSRVIAAELEEIRRATGTFSTLSLANSTKPAAERYCELHRTLRELAQKHHRCSEQLADLHANFPVNRVSGSGELSQRAIDTKKSEIAELEACIGRIKEEIGQIQKTFVEALK